MSEPTAPSNPTSQPVASTSSEGDWTDQVTALIVDTIDKVRSKTTGPILEVSKGMVYAVVALMLAVPIVVVFLVGMVRVFTLFIPAWATYLLFGSTFVIIGAVLWSKRGRVPS